MDDITRRAEAARAKILASGNPDLINQLHLMEATQARRASTPSPAPKSGFGLGGVLATGAAVAGGAWLGGVLGAAAIGSEMEQAFADIAAELGLDGADALPEGLEASPDDGIVQAAADDSGGFLDDLGLGDLGLGDIFDI